jgi:hypothetical protein
MKKNLLLFVAVFLATANLSLFGQYIPQSIQFAHNSTDSTVANLKVWVNDTVWVNSLAFQQATPKVTLALGTHTLGISYPTATSQAQSVLQFTFTFDQNIDDHFLVLDGKSGSSQYPLTILDYTNGPVGLIAPNDSYFSLHNGCTNCGAITVSVNAGSASTTTWISTSNIAYANRGMIQVQGPFPSGPFNQTLSLTMTSGTASYGTFTLPMQNYYQKWNHVLMNGVSNQSTKASGTNLSVVVVPSAGGSAIPLTKLVNTTGIRQNAAGSLNVNLFPNPADQKISLIVGNTANGLVDVVILDACGMMVAEFHQQSADHSGTIEMNVQHLPASVYFLKVSDGSGETHLRFIKE